MKRKLLGILAVVTLIGTMGVNVSAGESEQLEGSLTIYTNCVGVQADIIKELNEEFMKEIIA